MLSDLIPGVRCQACSCTSAPGRAVLWAAWWFLVCSGPLQGPIAWSASRWPGQGGPRGRRECACATCARVRATKREPVSTVNGDLSQNGARLCTRCGSHPWRLSSCVVQHEVPSLYTLRAGEKPGFNVCQACPSPHVRRIRLCVNRLTSGSRPANSPWEAVEHATKVGARAQRLLSAPRESPPEYQHRGFVACRPPHKP